MNAQDAWRIAYNQLELQLDRGTFDTWLREAVFLNQDANRFVIGTRNTYMRDMLQHRLYRTVWRVLSDVWGETVEIAFEVYQKPAPSTDVDDMPLFKLIAEQNEAEIKATTSRKHAGRPERPALPESELNARLTFDRYLVSNANRLAYEAARAVAEQPGRNYNPLLIHGDVGMGKTHLLQAIGLACQAKAMRVIYVTSEAFTNDLVDSIRQRTTAMFREKYRSVDVLLVDDVQFMGGKESTQEEFFHTFNALHTFNKQIVLVSDRHPSELLTLEPRLRSRFEGGLVVDLPTLTFETRVAILQMWCAEHEVLMGQDVIELMAARGKNNIRELEGLFTKVIAEAKFNRTPITLDVAAIGMHRFESPRPHGRTFKISDILRITAQ
ncbi:MAG: chromosomal replication initiator protein DnaA, partial [Armatimonadetes bacterium]|nr:chromosomal replication initiator protein DnaA [Anaerolineae bacterium]